MEADFAIPAPARSVEKSKLYVRACRTLREHDAETVATCVRIWEWDGQWTVRHHRTRFPATLEPETGIWVAGDDTPWPTLIEAIEHLEWLARDLDI
jgi:hypothetical protein